MVGMMVLCEAKEDPSQLNISAYEIALIAGGFTIIGTLLGALLGYRFSLSFAKVTERHRAAMKIRDAFKDEILALNPARHEMRIDLSDFLENAFSKHRAAVLDFSYFLEAKDRTAFYTAWYEYHCHPAACNDESVPFLEQYSCRGLTLEQEHERKKLAQSRINKILEFARSK